MQLPAVIKDFAVALKWKYTLMSIQFENETDRERNPLPFPLSVLPTAYDSFMSLVVIFCIPLVVLAPSHQIIPMWIGRGAILTAGAAGGLILVRRCRNTYTTLIITLVLGLLAIGLVGKGSGNTQAYIQIAQLLIFGTVVSTQRIARIESTTYLSLLALVIAVVVANFAWPTDTDVHGLTTVAIFGNANTLGLCLSVMIFFLIAMSQATPSMWLRSATYVVAGFLACFLVASGSRSSMITLLIYLSVIVLSRLTREDKRVLKTAATAALFIVPVITIGYPTLFGYQICFAPPSREVSILTELKISNAAPGSPAKDTPLSSHGNSHEILTDHGLLNENGLFGVKKGFASGRQVIWPVVIELSGSNLFFGRGLGTLPGANFPAPYNGLSAHNGFLQIYFQFGIVGLLLYVSIWVVVLVRALNISDPRARSLAVATLCGAWFQEIFEVVLVQNVFGIGIAFALLATTQFVWADRSDKAI